MDEGAGVGSCTAGVAAGESAGDCEVARRARLACGERDEEDCRRLVAPVGVVPRFVASDFGTRTVEDRVLLLLVERGLIADAILSTASAILRKICCTLCDESSRSGVGTVISHNSVYNSQQVELRDVKQDLLAPNGLQMLVLQASINGLLPVRATPTSDAHSSF